MAISVCSETTVFRGRYGTPGARSQTSTLFRKRFSQKEKKYHIVVARNTISASLSVSNEEPRQTKGTMGGGTRFFTTGFEPLAHQVTLYLTGKTFWLLYLAQRSYPFHECFMPLKERHETLEAAKGHGGHP